jgi:hypothetical protein
VVVAGIATASLPYASATRAGASATRPTLSIDHLVARASAPPQVLAPLPPPWLLVRGAQLRGGLPPVAFFLFSLSRRRVLQGHRGREHSSIPHLAASGALTVGSFAPSCVPPAPALAAAPHARSIGVWAGRTAQRSRTPSAEESEMSE